MNKNKDYLNWLYMMGMRDTIKFINLERFDFYTHYDPHIDLTGYILATFKSNQ